MSAFNALARAACLSLIGSVTAAGPASPHALERALDPGTDAISSQPGNSDHCMTWRESLEANYTDGVVILLGGRVVHEHYAGCLRQDRQHAAMSVTNSLTGLLAETPVAEDGLDLAARIGGVRRVMVSERRSMADMAP
ncbi:MAG: hypothetical protein MEQ07_08020 [Aquimonas sp.]|nr:hypothetical protein [Aquimonas sp.]